jgi:micrococcal nuclease
MVIFFSPPRTYAQEDNCDPSYPDVCIAPYPPDVNCDDIPDKDITVLPPDPHGLDGNDNDGIGCDS